MNICIKTGHDRSLWEEKLSNIKLKYKNLNVIYGESTKNVDLNDIDVFVAGRITDQELKSANQLEAIFVPFTGVNQLPLKELQEREITVFNSHVNAKFIAEKALALALSLMGRIVELDHHLRNAEWGGHDDSTKWTTLHNMKCGILGMGDIGQNIVNLIQPFNPTIVTLERYKKRPIPSENVEYYKHVEDVCKNSDILFISLPSTKETIDLIGEQILKAMKGKYIVNVGRANVVNEKALYNSLKDNHLKGAAFDVWYRYRDEAGKRTHPSHYPVQNLTNFVLSPHCSAHTEGAGTRHLIDTVSKIEQYLNNSDSLKPINKNLGY